MPRFPLLLPLDYELRQFINGTVLDQSKDELTRRDSHQRFCVIHEVPAGH